MRKIILFTLVVLLIFSGISFGDGLSIGVVPRIEALSILNYLSDINSWPKNEEFSQYKEDVDKYFAKIYKRKHPAVDVIQLLKTFGFKEEAPYLLLLHLSPFPEFKFIYPKKSFIRISKGIGVPTTGLKEALLKKFIFEFKAFYYDFNFDKFYKAHQSFYESIKNSVTDILPIDLISVLEGFFKVNALSYDIILSPSLPKNYGVYIRTPYGFKSFAVMGFPFFPHTEREKLEYVYQIIKELVRSFVEPIDYDYLKEIKKLKNLASYNMVKADMPTYKLVNEIIVSAVASHLMKILYSDKEEAWAIVKEERRGYYLVRPLSEFLGKYYENIDKYSNFAQFYPEIISYLSKVNRGKIKVRIPDSIGLLLRNNKDLVIVTENDLTKSLDLHIQNLKETLKKRGYDVAKIEEEKYLKNLNKYKNRIPIIYVSLDDMSLLGNIFSNVVPPLDVNKFDVSFLGFEYKGEYAFIARLPNVFTKKNDLIVVTSNTNEILKNIDVLNYLPFNYVILNKNLSIIRGGFQKFRLR